MGRRRDCNEVKVAKDEVLLDNVMFRIKGRVFLEKPKGYYIKKYVKEVDTGCVYAIMKKNRYLLHILLVVLLVLVSYLAYIQPKVKHTVNYPSKVYVHGNVVGLNVENAIVNKYAIKVRLVKDKVALTDWVELDPGESVGNVELTTKLDSKSSSSMCYIEYDIVGTLLNNNDAYSVLVIRN